MIEQVPLTRRVFLQKSVQGSAGLCLGVLLPGCGKRDIATLTGASTTNFEVNAYITIGTDDRVTVLVPKLEMGQGIYTGLATVVAEELDANWKQVIVKGAPVDEKRYGLQATSGSTSIRTMYQPLRAVGAAVRQMLVTAAAQAWRLPENNLDVKNGIVFDHRAHKNTGRQATFGELIPLAMRQPVPTTVTLKDSQSFSLIGQHLSRKDSGKTDGTALFTQDMQLPGMLTAVIAHPPRFGATLLDVDAKEARALPGVVDVLRLDNMVAVLAATFWQAKQGRDRLQLRWNENQASRQSSSGLFAYYYQLAETPGTVAQQRGDVELGFKKASQIIEAHYDLPFLAHAPMEPLSCVVQLHADRAVFWYGCQMQTQDQQTIAELLGIKPQQITINTLLAGGSFGRRLTHDCVREAAQIAKAFHKPVPIKLVWTREDDMQSGYYRPMTVHKLKAGLDKQGNIIAWQHRIVGQSILASQGYGVITPEPTLVEGAVDLLYAIPNIAVEHTIVELPVPVLWWRSVGHSHTAFAKEVFIDELAAESKQDPLVFRIKLLTKHPKHKRVLALAGEKANWGLPLPPNKARGVALHESFNTIVAQVAEVTVMKDGSYCVDKVTCVVDCGLAVNPDIIKAQMEGGIGFGLSAVLLNEITFKDGRVEQSNFHDYQVLRIAQMPAIDVHIVSSVEPPTGVGEPAVPVIAPAVANALRAATGKSYRCLPIDKAI